MTITIRTFKASDHAFVLSLVSRFTEFELPPWRERQAIDRTNQHSLEEALAAPPDQSSLLIAEDTTGTALGFLRLQTQTDSFTGESFAYISEIAVAAHGEGQGVGQALMQAAETWTRACGYRLLALFVFAQNTRARQFYKTLGFTDEVVKCVKEIR